MARIATDYFTAKDVISEDSEITLVSQRAQRFFFDLKQFSKA
jgi:hypothetical protein